MDNPAFHSNEPNNGVKRTSSALSANSQPLSSTYSKKDKIRINDLELENEKNEEFSKGEEDAEEEDIPIQKDIISKIIISGRSGIYEFIMNRKRLFKLGFLLTLFLLYNAYLGTAIAYKVRHNVNIEFCNGLGFLIIMTGISYWALFYYLVLKKHYSKTFKNLAKPIGRLFEYKYASLGVLLLLIVGMIVFIIVDAKDQPERLISLGGAAIILLIGFLISSSPGHVKWRQVLGGIFIQFTFGLIILRWNLGRDIFDCASCKITTFLKYSDNGSIFIYDYLARENGDNGPVFAFSVLPVIFFFSFFISILYYYGIMQWVCQTLGWLLQISLDTTAAESMSAAGNIFIGQTEAPILIKPFLPQMTKSEIHAIMTGGFATIAGGVMAAYISFGIEPTYLLSASFMAAPSALAVSKLVYPETKHSKTKASDIKNMSFRTGGNALDAAAGGVSDAIMLIANIIGNLIAFIAFVAFLNAVINWFGILVGFDDLTLEWILGKVFFPFAFILGIDSEDTENVALLLGLKTTVNEFVAYQELTRMNLSPRSEAIATYALCGFANFSSIGIQLGGLGAMCPERRKDLAKLVGTAFISGTMANLLNACVAGSLIDPNNISAGGVC